MADRAKADRLSESGDEHSWEGFRAQQARESEEGMACCRKPVEAYEAAFAVAPEDDVLLAGNFRLRIGARKSALGEVEAILVEAPDHPSLDPTALPSRSSGACPDRQETPRPRPQARKGPDRGPSRCTAREAVGVTGR